MAALEAQLNKNSKNSSKPPSSDGPGARASEKKKETGRRRGGQPGHEGSQRKLLPVAEVDSVVDVYPERCEDCQEKLPQTPDENATRRQVTELPEIKAHMTEYRRHGGTCRCGHRTLAEAT